jgi:prolipoprotein diacylglyceryltransferase
VPIAVVFFQFDPFAHLPGDLTVRWAVIALVAVIIASLVLAGILARAGGVRPDDVAFVAVGIVPGAVIGGRLGHFLIHNAYYGSAPGRLLDPSIGGMDLGLAVVGGFLTGCYVASLLGAPLGRWLHLAAAPVLFALGAGKLTMVLAGSGQGVPTVTDPATAYLGPGPWGSLLPALPSVPSQALEGAATLAILAVLTVILIVGAFRSRDGRLFYFAIGLWAVARALVSTTWRDAVRWPERRGSHLGRHRGRLRRGRRGADDPQPWPGARRRPGRSDGADRTAHRHRVARSGDPLALLTSA